MATTDAVAPAQAGLRSLRRKLGLTQSELADRLRVSPITVHRWEAGKSRPHAMARERLEELAEAARAAALRPSPPGAPTAPAHPLGPVRAPPLDFAGAPEAVSAVVSAWRLKHGHQFNPVFASETSRIDPLPHQRIAVYERMLTQDPLRFLLADDAGAGKTIMTGLYVREMLSRSRLRRVLVVPPAGLVGNWERELRTLFRLRFRIVSGPDLARPGPTLRGAADAWSDLAIVSLDTLAGERAFGALREAGAAAAYDLVVFDEAHKLSATADDRRVRKTRRYELAEALAGYGRPVERFAGLGWSARHLLLLTATPHMGKDSPYHHLWRLLDHRVFSTPGALRRFPPAARSRYFVRRTKEAMVDLQGQPLYPHRACDTFSYDLTAGPHGEQALYDETTEYLRHTYNRALKNRPAVRLAMSVFQRRLASSTYALQRSFERRMEKLERTADDLRSGRVSTEELNRRQRELAKAHAGDFFDRYAADEEEECAGAGERNEEYEDEVLGAVTAVTVEELQREVRIVAQLRERASQLLESGRESKFDKLREVLDDPRHEGEKWLIFSEHRDTVRYLVGRLEGLGYTGKVAQIHGGMAWPAREEQVERFRPPGGASYMVATDAAGEGINLQFCRLMVNYDIPWNPARLEQRMGRIHRYGQKHNVQIVNLVAGKTHEGRVLRVLLDKLEAIRRELDSDKVFDVIGKLFDNQSLRSYMLKSLEDSSAEAGAGEAAEQVASALTEDRVRAVGEQERQTYGDPDDLVGRLPGMRGDIKRERYLQLLPGYVRSFVERAAQLLGLEVRGDLDGFFALAPRRAGAVDPLLLALDGYPEEARERLCVWRPEVAAGAGGSSCAPSVWLHPGEPVFDALASQVLDAFKRDALRGAVFVDRRADAPYMLHLALATVEEAPEPGATAGSSQPQVLERRLLALRDDGKTGPTEDHVERLLVLSGADVSPGAVPLASRSLSMRAEATAHAESQIVARLVEDRRDAERAELPERQREVKTGFGLRSADVARRRKELAAAGIDEEALEEAKEEQDALKVQQERALAGLDAAPERIVSGGVRFLAHALVVPAADYAVGDLEEYDTPVEEAAVGAAVAWERERGGVVRDVSKPRLARAAGFADWPGFDLVSERPDGEQRHIEVKGRAGRGAVHMEENEWTQASHLGDQYWLYVVFDCATPKPHLSRIRHPFYEFVVRRATSTRYTIPVGAILEAEEDGNSS